MLYVLDHKYKYHDEEKIDEKYNKDVLFFCRKFKDVARYLLKENKSEREDRRR